MEVRDEYNFWLEIENLLFLIKRLIMENEIRSSCITLIFCMCVARDIQ